MVMAPENSSSPPKSKKPFTKGGKPFKKGSKGGKPFQKGGKPFMKGGKPFMKGGKPFHARPHEGSSLSPYWRNIKDELRKDFEDEEAKGIYSKR